MNNLLKSCGIMDIIVFVAATLAIIGVFYEGMTMVEISRRNGIGRWSINSYKAYYDEMRIMMSDLI